MTRLRLEANENAPAAARAALEPLRHEIDSDVLERVQLLTSEVVTNAVKFSGGQEVRLEIWRSGSTVAVATSDDGPGFVPVPPRGTIAEMEGGFGLPLINRLSTAWGSGTGDDSWVWFEICPRIMSVAVEGHA